MLRGAVGKDNKRRHLSGGYLPFLHQSTSDRHKKASDWSPAVAAFLLPMEFDQPAVAHVRCFVHLNRG